VNDSQEQVHHAVYIHIMKPMETLVEYLLSMGRHYTVISEKFLLPFLNDSQIDAADALNDDARKLVSFGYIQPTYRYHY